MANQPRSKKGAEILKQANVLTLILRMMGDNRISFWLKLLPIASLIYLFMPDPIWCIADDSAVILVLNFLFIHFSPKEVVEELRNQ